MSFQEVAKVMDVVPGTMKSFAVGDKQLLIVNVSGTFYAMDGICTHAGGDLSKGKLEGTVVTCPRHGSRFDVTTAKSLSGPKFGFVTLKTRDEKAYEVKTEGGRIMVNLP